MPFLFTPPSVSELNDRWRNGLGQPLTPADLRSIAEAEGVTPRTVQRWVTEAGQQRNAFPERLAGKPFEEWPARYQERALRTLDIADGVANSIQGGGRLEAFTERFATLADAQRWLEAVRNDALDPWVNQVWEEMRIVKGADGWEVRVRYDRSKYTPVLIVAA